MKGWKISLFVFFVFALDYTTKALVNFFIPPLAYAPAQFPFGGVAVFQDVLGIDFCLNNVSNHGAAWGVFSSLPHLLLGFRIAVVIALFYYMVFSKKSAPYRLPLAFIFAGAVGNIVDYFIYGHVVDMFHFIFWGYSYPVFNIADSSIFCGVAWLFLLPYLKPSSHAAIKV